MRRALALVAWALAVSAPSRALRSAERVTWAAMPDVWAADEAEEYYPAALAASSRPNVRAPGRPWWAGRSGDGWKGSMSRRFRHTLQRHLGLSDALLDLVLAGVPLRFHLVAALAHAPEGWVVNVWELAITPHGTIPYPCASRVSELRLDIPEWMYMTWPDPPHFVPGSETLVTSVLRYDGKNAVFWDARSGRAVLSVAGVEILAVARGGGSAAVTAISGPPDFHTHPAIWNVHTGELVSPAGDRFHWHEWRCRAAFSPSGLRVATFGHHYTDWGVVIFDSGSGEKLCDHFASSEVFLDVPAVSFAFDGERVAICRGFGEPAVRLDVRWTAGYCELVQSPSRESCDDVFLPGRLRLEIAHTEARVILSVDGDADELLHVAEIHDLGQRSDGWFSPDGRKALVCSGVCYIWAFADGKEPGGVEEVVSDIAFTADSSAIVGIAENSKDAVCFDLDGRPALRFGGAGDEYALTKLAAGEVTGG